MILTASSPFFDNLLKKNRHPHPLIYMKGVKFEDLLSIVDFLYCGEANVYQENLDSFLRIAEDLKDCGKICTSRNMLRRHKYQCKSEI